MNIFLFASTVKRVLGQSLLCVPLSFPTAIQATKVRASIHFKVGMQAQVMIGA